MKSAADAEREVEASRSNLDRTVEALKDKMTPGQLFDEASRAMGSTGQQVFSKFVEQAKDNPMPLAVMGLGLAWLMSSSGHRSAPTYEPRSFSPAGDGAGLGAKARDLGDKASGMVAGVKEKLSGAAASVSESGQSAAQTLSSAASTAAEKAGQYRDQAQRSFSRVLETEPLLIGAIGLAVGAAIGAALPHTDVEDRAVGPLRDKVVEKGKEIAQETMEQAGSVAQAAYGAIKEELTAGDGDGAPLADRAGSAARSAVQAARDELQGDGESQSQGKGSAGSGQSQGSGGSGQTQGSGLN